MHMESQSRKLSRNGDQEDELLLDIDMPLIGIIYTYSPRLSRWLVRLFPCSNSRKKVCAYRLTLIVPTLELFPHQLSGSS